MLHYNSKTRSFLAL